MSISRRNHEGYCDPTVYEALTNIDRQERAAGRGLSFRPIVFICSPYAGDVEANVGNALCIAAWPMNAAFSRGAACILYAFSGRQRPGRAAGRLLWAASL